MVMVYTCTRSRDGGAVRYDTKKAADIYKPDLKPITTIPQDFAPDTCSFFP